jgi:hypothetical protein
MNDILFLLPADFENGGAAWYCRECAEVRGLLAYYPRLAERLDVRTVDFARPRRAMVELLGGAHQNAPTLVIADPARRLPEHVAVKAANGRRFLDDAKAIGEYLAVAYGIGRPHP